MLISEFHDRPFKRWLSRELTRLRKAAAKRRATGDGSLERWDAARARRNLFLPEPVAYHPPYCRRWDDRYDNPNGSDDPWL